MEEPGDLSKQAAARCGDAQAPPAKLSPQHPCSSIPVSEGCTKELLLLSPALLRTAHSGHTVSPHTVSPQHLPAGAEESCEKAQCPGPRSPCLLLVSILVPGERHTVQSRGWNTPASQTLAPSWPSCLRWMQLGS